MRASRAYLAGLGTTSVLVAGAMLLLVVVSTLMAFRGWSPADVGGGIDGLVLRDDEPALRLESRRPAKRVAARARDAPSRPPRAAAPPPAPRRPAARAAGQRSSAPPPATGGLDDGGGAGATPPGIGGDLEQLPQPPPPPPRFSPPPAPRPPPNPVRDLTQGLGATAQGATDGLGHAVGGLSPELGGTVADTGESLADLLRGLGLPQG